MLNESASSLFSQPNNSNVTRPFTTSIRSNKAMKEKLLLFALGIIIGLLLVFGIDRCTRNKLTPVIEKKQGKTVLVSAKTETKFDTVCWIAHYKANSKPIIKWRTRKPTHDTTEVQPNYVYSPCDSTFVSLDSGVIEGVKYAIRDTTNGNVIIGRSIKFQVPQLTINKNTINTNDSLRVDTVYVTKEQPFGTNAKWFFRGFIVGGALGVAGGTFLVK